MKNETLKQQISKVYRVITKAVIYSSMIITVIELLLKIFDIDFKLIINIEWIILTLMIITPFTGTLIATVYYTKKKHIFNAITTWGIIIFITVSLLRGYIFK